MQKKNETTDHLHSSEQQKLTNNEKTVNIIVQHPEHKRRIGKNRNVLMPLLLPFLTFGIYNLVWLYKLFSEADFYCERKVNIDSAAVVIILLFIPIVNMIWGIMLWFKTPGLITKMQIADGIPENEIKHYGHYGWWNLLPFIGNIIWIVLTQSAFNHYWDNVRQL